VWQKQLYEDLISSAQKLLDLGIGDTGRLGYIIDVLKQDKKFYLSDQQYLNELISKYKDSEKKRSVIISMKPVDSSVTSKQDTATPSQVLETSYMIVEYVKTAMDELRNELKSINEKLGRIETETETKTESVVGTETETKSAETEIKESTGKVEKHTGKKVFFAFTIFVGWHVAANNTIYNIFSEVPSNLIVYLLPLYTLIGFIGASEHLLSFILGGMLVAWVIIGLSGLSKSKSKKTSPESFG